MTRKGMVRWALGLFLAASIAGFVMTEALAQAQPDGQKMDDGRPAQVDLFGRSPYEGGHLKYSYKVSREGVAGYSITTTEIIPQDDGLYRVESSSVDVIPLGAVNVSFFGIPLRGLGFRVPTSSGGTVDLSPLSAVEDQVLEPSHEIVLPDGGYLAVGDAGTIAGLDVVFATYTHADFSNVQINLAMPVDLSIRNLLPLFPLLELEYASEVLSPEGAAEDHERMRSFSRVELVEFVYEP